MTLHELAARVIAGRLIIAGELRAATAKTSGFVDRKTGLAMPSILCTYFVERGALGELEFVKITRRAPAEVIDPAKAVLGVEKGKTYAFEVESLERKAGVFSAWMGRFEPEEITLDGAPAAAPRGAAVGVPPNLVYIETSPSPL